MSKTGRLSVVGVSTPAPRRDPFTTWWESWELALEAANRSPHTISSYRESLKQFGEFLRDNEGSRSPLQVGREDVRRFVTHLQRTRSPQTAAVRFRSLQAFYTWLRKEGEIEKSPLQDMEPPQVSLKVQLVLTSEEILRLKRSLQKAAAGKETRFEGRRDLALFELFTRTGARRAELMNLKVTDVERHKEKVRVIRKGGNEKWITLDKEASAALDRYLRIRDEHPHATRSPWLWLGRQRGGQNYQLTANGLYQMLQRRAVAVGIEDLHPHALRHLWTARSQAAGVSEADIMEQGGWSSPAMLHRIYGRDGAAERAHRVYRAIDLYEDVEQLATKRPKKGPEGSARK